MTFASVLPVILGVVLILLGIFLAFSFVKKKKLCIIVLIPCIILIGVSLVLSVKNTSATDHIQAFEAYSVDDLSKTNELLDQSLFVELKAETNSASPEAINHTQISNFDVSFSDGVFANVKYSFLVATDIYPLEKIVQINYVGDIFSEPSRGIGNEAYANQLISCGDLKNVLSIIGGSEIIHDISSDSPTYMELSFIGITDIGNASHDVEKIYVIMQNEIVPLSEVENMQQASYFVFNIITDTDNIWICY